MKRKTLAYVVGAIVVALLAALLLGVPLGILVIFGFVLICPLGMFWMMRGMDGMGGDTQGASDIRQHPHHGGGPSR